jgi:hypothetical protein
MAWVWWSDPLDVGLRQCGFVCSLRGKRRGMWRRCLHMRELRQRLSRLSDFIMKCRIGVLYGKLPDKSEVRKNWLDEFTCRRKCSTRTFHVYWPIWMKFGIDDLLVMRLRISGFLKSMQWNRTSLQKVNGNTPPFLHFRAIWLKFGAGDVHNKYLNDSWKSAKGRPCFSCWRERNYTYAFSVKS